MGRFRRFFFQALAHIFKVSSQALKSSEGLFYCDGALWALFGIKVLTHNVKVPDQSLWKWRVGRCPQTTFDAFKCQVRVNSLYPALWNCWEPGHCLEHSDQALQIFRGISQSVALLPRPLEPCNTWSGYELLIIVQLSRTLTNTSEALQILNRVSALSKTAEAVEDLVRV